MSKKTNNLIYINRQVLAGYKNLMLLYEFPVCSSSWIRIQKFKKHEEFGDHEFVQDYLDPPPHPIHL